MSKVSQFEIDEAILDNTPIEEAESTPDDHAEFVAWKQRQAEEEEEEKWRNEHPDYDFDMDFAYSWDDD